MERKRTIMIIDDSPGMVETFKDILEDRGYGVVTALNGCDAFKSVKESRVDIAFIDIRMPGINGIETFKELKKLSPRTIVFMMTAFAEEELLREAEEQGMYALIYKPFDLTKILSVIEECLGDPLILIVDDVETDREALKDILHDRGYKITSVNSGYEAIEEVKIRRHDIIFLDQLMPGLQGQDTLLEIKKINPAASVIMMTAFPVEEIVSSCLESGAQDWIYKPYEPENLVKTVNDIMAARRSTC